MKSNINIVKGVLYAFFLLAIEVTVGQQENPQQCIPNRVIEQNINEGRVELYKATNTIIAKNIVKTSGVGTYLAQDEIVLSENFEAKAGSDFRVLINDDCDIIFGDGFEDPLPDDEFFKWQWGHQNTANAKRYNPSINDINARESIGIRGIDANIFRAWTTTRGSSLITVAIVDSGLDPNHPDIDYSRVLIGRNFSNNSTNTSDDVGHGTHVTGIIAATPFNGRGIAGIDEFCNILPLKYDFLDPNATNQVTQAIRYAVDNPNKANIISMSFGGHPISTATYNIEREAVIHAIENGALLLAATGNDDDNEIDYPARFEDVVGVGALSPCNTRKSRNPLSCDNDTRRDGDPRGWGSNYGEGLDIMAPGVLLPTIDVVGQQNGFSRFSDIYLSDSEGNYLLDGFGTSLATPYASGVASLIWAANPSLKNYQVRHILNTTAVSLGTTDTGNGRINAAAAVQMAKNFNANTEYLLPDLKVEVLSNVPSTVDLNSNIPLSIRVTNRGDNFISSSTLKFKLRFITDSSRNRYVEYDLLSANVNSLGINTNQTRDYTLSIPCLNDFEGINLENGLQFLSIEVDNTTDEISKLNNEVLIPIQLIENQLPDITIKNPELLNVSDTSIRLKFDLKNLGQGYAELVDLTTTSQRQFYRYYLSDDTILDRDTDISINPRINPINPIYGEFFICPSTVKTISPSSITVNHGLKPYLFIEVNANNLVSESDQTNNIMMIQIPINNRLALSSIEAQKLGQKPSTDKTELVIAPNPSTSNITINVTKNGTIHITDIAGTKIGTYTVTSQHIEINIDSYAKGLYLVEFIDEYGHRIGKKLIKN